MLYLCCVILSLRFLGFFKIEADPQLQILIYFRLFFDFIMHLTLQITDIFKAK